MKQPDTLHRKQARCYKIDFRTVACYEMAIIYDHRDHNDLMLCDFWLRAYQYFFAELTRQVIKEEV